MEEPRSGESLFNLFLVSRPDLTEEDARSIFMSALAQRRGLKAIGEELDYTPEGLTPFADLVEREILHDEES